jgi:hypothetical protein
VAEPAACFFKRVMKRYFLIASGIISLSLGVIGIFIPLLPTTPFLLLAAACFLRSSDPLYQWLMHHRWFGIYISNYIKYRAVSLKTKVTALLFLWLTILSSAIFFTDQLWVRILLIVIAFAVTIHILKLRTMKKEN